MAILGWVLCEMSPGRCSFSLISPPSRAASYRATALNPVASGEVHHEQVHEAHGGQDVEQDQGQVELGQAGLGFCVKLAGRFAVTGVAVIGGRGGVGSLGGGSVGVVIGSDGRGVVIGNNGVIIGDNFVIIGNNSSVIIIISDNFVVIGDNGVFFQIQIAVGFGFFVFGHVCAFNAAESAVQGWRRNRVDRALPSSPFPHCDGRRDRCQGDLGGKNDTFGDLGGRRLI